MVTSQFLPCLAVIIVGLLFHTVVSPLDKNHVLYRSSTPPFREETISVFAIALIRKSIYWLLKKLFILISYESQ